MSYYGERLSGTRLQACYDIAPPRVRRYLEAEISHILARIGADDMVLELGCGYGRVTFALARAAARAVGIDTSRESLKLARELGADLSNCEFLEMDAAAMTFENDRFDGVVCVQNGICAFGVDRESLMREAIRVARPGGRIIFSTYAARFWPHRLDWFEKQAARGLLGAIDYAATGDGTIVCRDGFRADALDALKFQDLCRGLNLTPLLTEVDGSSLFCEIIKPDEAHDSD